MAEGLNKALLIGYLGQDPDLRYTQGGTAVLNIRMATTESYQPRDGDRQERTEWHTVTVWGRRGEALNKYLNKGSRVFIEGRIQTRKWEDRDGNTRYSTDIVANNVVLLGGKRNGNPAQQHDEPSDISEDDDIPF